MSTFNCWKLESKSVQKIADSLFAIKLVAILWAQIVSAAVRLVLFSLVINVDASVLQVARQQFLRPPRPQPRLLLLQQLPEVALASACHVLSCHALLAHLIAADPIKDSQANSLNNLSSLNSQDSLKKSNKSKIFKTENTWRRQHRLGKTCKIYFEIFIRSSVNKIPN